MVTEKSQHQEPVHHCDPKADGGLGEIRQARGRAAFSMFLNLSLALGKGVAGVMGNSSALLGDAVHSATDVVGSGAAFIGLWLAGKKHPSFPYGMYKAETLATLVTSGVLILAGYEIGRRAVLGPGTLPDVHLTLPVALISLVITFAFGFYQLYSSRKLHSSALEADARDYIADGLSTVVVVISLICAHFQINLDRVAAGLVSAFIFWSGGRLLWRSIRDLMDEAIDRETERELIAMVEAHPRVDKVEKCLSRNTGGRYIIDLDVVLRSQSHAMAHRISHRLEEELCRKFPRVVMARIKTHIPESRYIRRLTPLKDRGGEIEARLARAPWFMEQVFDRKSQAVVSEKYFQNPYWEEDSKRGFLVGKWILGLNPDQVMVVMEKEGTAFELLKEAGIEFVLSNPQDPDMEEKKEKE